MKFIKDESSKSSKCSHVYLSGNPCKFFKPKRFLSATLFFLPQVNFYENLDNNSHPPFQYTNKDWNFSNSTDHLYWTCRLMEEHPISNIANNYPKMSLFQIRNFNTLPLLRVKIVRKYFIVEPSS